MFIYAGVYLVSRIDAQNKLSNLQGLGSATLVLALIYLSGCTEAAFAPEVSKQKVEVVSRGGSGYLSLQEASYFQWLGWPQTYRDMTGTFGYANRSTRTADIYIISDTGQEVWVYYENTTATGYSIR